MKKKNKEKVEDQKVNEELTAEQENAEQAESQVQEKTPEDTIAELKDQLLRLAAEYQNFQKRSMRQIDQAREFAAENMVKIILPVMDNFQHALEKGKESGDVVSVMQGVQIVYDHLNNTLESAGMKKIIVEPGCNFEPGKHEALLHLESADVEPNCVIMELAPGYEMNGRTLRPAKVSIAKAVAPQVENTDDSQDASEE